MTALFSQNRSMTTKICRHALDQPIGPGPFDLSAGQELAIAGWAFLEPWTMPLPDVELQIVSQRTGRTAPIETARCPRPDIATHFGADELLMSGFAGTVRVGHELQGRYSVRLHLSGQTEPQEPIDLCSVSVSPGSYEVVVRQELAAKFLHGRGLEVGALQRRLEVPPSCIVTYVDRMPLPELLAHYPELQGLPIQPPDLIDDGETLLKVASGSQDFVIANHFLEHCENPLQTLVNLGRVLKDGGVLFMAVPDKRFTFDFDRPVTRYGDLADAFRQGQRGNRDALYLEWATLVLRAQPAEAGPLARKLADERYSIHFNVWSLPDLLEFVARSQADFGLPFRLEWVVSSENEVILILGKRSH
jgi:SAM-dependent methyltransferase